MLFVVLFRGNAFLVREDAGSDEQGGGVRLGRWWPRLWCAVREDCVIGKGRGGII